MRFVDGGMPAFVASIVLVSPNFYLSLCAISTDTVVLYLLFFVQSQTAFSLIQSLALDYHSSQPALLTELYAIYHLFFLIIQDDDVISRRLRDTYFHAPCQIHLFRQIVFNGISSLSLSLLPRPRRSVPS